jgi:hypothetical protein
VAGVEIVIVLVAIPAAVLGYIEIAKLVRGWRDARRKPQPRPARTWSSFKHRRR